MSFPTALLHLNWDIWKSSTLFSFDPPMQNTTWKCSLLRFCPSPHTTCQSNFTINHQQLLPTDAHNDLGIVMSANLSWRKDYDLIPSCAYRTLGLLHRTFNTTNSVRVKKLLYPWYSQITYCSIIALICSRISTCWRKSKDIQPNSY